MTISSTSWERSLLLLAFGLAVTVAVASATEQEESETERSLGDELASTSGEEVEGRVRIRKRFYKHLLKALTPIISSLGTILVVKTKFVLLSVFLAGIFYFGSKLWGGGFCGHSIVSDFGPPFISDEYSGYHATGPEIYSSYPGPEYLPPSSSVSNAYLPPDPSKAYLPPSPSNAYLPPSGSASAPSKRRAKRAVDNPEDDELLENEMYWTDQLTDMAFSFLGVSTRTCRKRFVCEFDFQARQNPILLFATRAMGRDIFHNYRDADDERAKNYRDCGRIYAACAVPKKSAPKRRGGRPTATTEQPQEDDADDWQNDISSGDVDSSRSSRTNQQSSSDAAAAAAAEPLGKLILRRKTRVGGSN